MTRGLRTLMFSEQIMTCLTLHSLDAYDDGLDLLNKKITLQRDPETILDSLEMTQHDEYHLLHSFPLIK